MKPVRLLTLGLALALLLPPRPGKGAEPMTSAGSAALFEVDSGRFLYGDNEHQRAYMASTTKVMTGLLAVELGNLDEPVPVPDAAVGVEGSSAYLARGETLTLRDLLYALMLVSGNDAAVTIAVYLAGSCEAFAELMNRRAAELGCVNTHFVNPNGLPDENHYTTASDLGRIAAAAMRNPDFRAVAGTTYHETESGDRPRTFKNKNKLLWQYPGGNGVKTGFTKAAGRCLVFSAERDGMTIVGVALNAPDMWADAYALLDYGFALVERKRLVSGDTALGTVQVAGSEKKSLAVYAKDDILYPVRRDGSDQLRFELDLTKSLSAPVAPGTAAGSLTLTVNGEQARTVPLEVREAAPEKRSLFRWLQELLPG